MLQVMIYFAGIKEAEYFVRFAESFIFPLKSLRTERQIKEFIVQNDVSHLFNISDYYVLQNNVYNIILL